MAILYSLCRRFMRSELARELKDMFADMVLLIVVLLDIYVVASAISALVPTDDVKTLFHKLDEYAGLLMMGLIILRGFVRWCQRTFRNRDGRK